MRPTRVAWIAWRDLRLVVSGRSWWKLPLLALLLLLPVGGLHIGPPTTSTGPPKVRGEIPEALVGQLQSSKRAGVLLLPGPVVVANRVPPALRRVLDHSYPEGRVELLDLAPERRLPGRSLLVALLALSLLTGPLTESTAGERSQGSLETLMSAGISRGELVAGKWLAWTAVASLGTLLVAALGLLRGTQEPGVWPLGLPLVAGVAVAFGLWLQRHSADQVGAAARTMRVVPIAAMLAGGAAWALSQLSPSLGALVPFGAALLLAGDLMSAPLQVALAALSSLFTIGLLLAATASTLDRVVPRSSGALGLVATAALLYWLPVLGPEVWAAAGNPELATSLSLPVSLATAGGLLLGAALVALVRDHRQLLKPPGTPLFLLCALTGLTLALLPRLDLLPSSHRLEAGLVGSLLLAAGQEFLFRGALQQRAGPWVAGAAWVLVCSPHAPLRGIVAALALGALAKRGGVMAALTAHLFWALLA